MSCENQVQINEISRLLKIHKKLIVIKENGGKGSFGQVLFVQDQNNPNLKYAVKAQYLDDGTGKLSKQKLEECRDEANKMKKLKHKNVVQIHSDYEIRLFHFIQMNLCKSSLLTWSQENKSNISDSMFQFYTTQILDGVEYIHDQNYVLRDLKLDNILLDVDGKIQICDFGGAKHLRNINQVSKGTNIFGTYSYFPPEILEQIINNDDQNNKIKQIGSSDIWALGVCLSVLGGANQMKFMSCHESNFEIPRSQYLSEKANNFIKFILQRDIKKRPNIPQIREKIFSDFIVNAKEIEIELKTVEHQFYQTNSLKFQEVSQHPEKNLPAASTLATTKTIQNKGSNEITKKNSGSHQPPKNNSCYCFDCSNCLVSFLKLCAYIIIGICIIIVSPVLPLFLPLKLRRNSLEGFIYLVGFLYYSFLFGLCIYNNIQYTQIGDFLSDESQDIKEYNRTLLAQAIIFYIFLFFQLIIFIGYLFHHRVIKVGFHFFTFLNIGCFLLIEIIGFSNATQNSIEAIREYRNVRYHLAVFVVCLSIPVYIFVLILKYIKY